MHEPIIGFCIGGQIDTLIRAKQALYFFFLHSALKERGGGGERKRQADRQRQRDWETETDTGRQTQRQRQTETERDMGRKRGEREKGGGWRRGMAWVVLRETDGREGDRERRWMGERGRGWRGEGGGGEEREGRWRGEGGGGEERVEGAMERHTQREGYKETDTGRDSHIYQTPKYHRKTDRHRRTETDRQTMYRCIRNRLYSLNPSSLPQLSVILRFRQDNSNVPTSCRIFLTVVLNCVLQGVGIFKG